MRILLIHQYFLEKDEPGGSRFNEMAKVWIEEGHEVTVICGLMYYLAGTVPEAYKGLKYHYSSYAPGLDVLRCYVSPDYNASFRGRLWAYFSFVWYGIWGILLKVKKQKFDIVVATSPPLFVGIIAWVASRLKGIPYVFEVRDLWPESAIDTGVLKNKVIIRMAFWFEKFIYKHALLINVLTPAFKQRLIDVKKIKESKISFVPNACDFSFSDSLLESFDVAAFRKELGWGDQFVIIYVGAHGVANHLTQLLDAAEILGDTFRIVMMGEGMKRKDLMAETENRKLRNVQFVTSKPKREVIKYILASDAGASVLKRADTFKTVYSNKTFDYMSCKKPILMVIDGVSKDLVMEAQCGLFAEPEDVADIVEKIRIFEANRAHTKAMGENGYTYAKEHFDRQVLASKYVNEMKTRLPGV